MKAYKICSALPSESARPCLVTLEIPPSAHCIATEFSPNGEVIALRCDWAKVIGIVELRLKDGVFSVIDDAVSVAYNCCYNPDGKVVNYRLNGRVWVRKFDGRDYIVGGNGIHCFTSQVAALEYYQPQEVR